MEEKSTEMIGGTKERKKGENGRIGFRSEREMQILEERVEKSRRIVVRKF